MRLFRLGYRAPPVRRKPEKTISQNNPALDMRPLRLLPVGILLYLFDFRLFGFDLLADFAGYALIALSMHRLSRCSAAFRPAGWIAAALCVLSLTGLYKETPADVGFYLEQTYAGLLPGIVQIALSVAFVFVFARALEVLAAQNGCPDLADACRVTRWFFLFAKLSVLAAPLAAAALLSVPLAGGIMFLVLAALGLGGDACLLALAYKGTHVPRAFR